MPEVFRTQPPTVTVPPLKPIVTSKPYEIIEIDVLELGHTRKGNRYGNRSFLDVWSSISRSR